MSFSIPGKSIPRFRFSSKAATLEQLAARVTRGRLCDQVVVGAGAWRADRGKVLGEIAGRFGGTELMIRSSAAVEDSWENSLAGAHLSVADVAHSGNTVAAAIDEVFASYSDPSAADEVLVQPMVKEVTMSGVVLTRDLDTGSPYYVINYDDFTGRTDTVTGGGESKTVLVHRSRIDALRSPRIRKLIDCVVELEAITGSHELDIEFCITRAEDVYILQVRPLAARQQWTPIPDAAVDMAIDRIRVAIAEAMRPEPDLAGRTTILSEMTDWNPAEMIGTAPRPLALSLYKSLITDRVWAAARAGMGYRDVAGPLLVDFYGRPFIDVRRSLNSFLPAGLDEGIALHLVDHQLARLAVNPELHDKVEFEIAVTCRDFSFPRARRELADAGFAADDVAEFEAALATLTGAALATGRAGINDLLARTDRFLQPRLDADRPAPLARVRRLLDDCRTHGTLPFSQLARHAFIGVAFLKSLVERGVFDQRDVDAFMHGIQTVATRLVRNMRELAAGTLSRSSFLDRYGHLRPGTYDILSWRYDEKPALYLGHGTPGASESRPGFRPSAAKRNAVEALLGEYGYRLSADQLLDYMTRAIEAREQAKFAFTRGVSDALSALARWGEEVGLSRDDLSFLPIEAISADDGRGVGALRDLVANGRQGSALTRAVRLPHMIVEPSDIDVVRLPLGRPTFITGKTVTGPTVTLATNDAPDIAGRIILIDSADPGFDWIFSHRILGLITKYGGANSHMAIRCAEFGLPAAIGCGERLFDILSKAAVIELNAAARKVTSH